jgi:hypothetical protein
MMPIVGRSNGSESGSPVSGPSSPPGPLPCGTTVTQQPDGVDVVHHVDCGAKPLAGIDPESLRRAAEVIGKFLARG